MAAKSIEKLLGSQLLTKDGAEAKSTSDALGDADRIGLYFSAHWCPPCKHFTPVLAEKYKTLKEEGKKFEIVFISSDKDEKAFNEYYGEHPWLALPYSDREKKNQLSKKYKVSGIPTLVILDSEGNLISKDGRSKVIDEEYPWNSPSVKESLGDTFVSADGTSVSADSLKDKNLALYFSAHWCPPCKHFTPKLADVYKEMKASGRDDFEFVFLSSDNDEASFKEYHASMPWLALPFDNRKGKNALSSHFEVSGIPTLVTLGPESENGDRPIINANARGPASKDDAAKNFPWTPPLVPDLDEADCLNDTPTIVVLSDKCNDAKVKDIYEKLAAVQKKEVDAAKKSESDVTFACVIARPKDGLADRVRALCEIETEEDKDLVPEIILIDIQDDGAFYRGVDGAYDSEDIESFVEKFKKGELERKQLKM